jgi:hypothetical protein
MIVRIALALVIAHLLAGCESMYFQRADTGSGPVAQHRLAAWPDREYWWGLVFNGDKIGFSHLALAPAGDGLFEIRSEAAVVMRFMGFEKRINLKSLDVVRDDLQLVRFRYDYLIDGNELTLAGERRDNVLELSITHGGDVARQSLEARERVYPQSAIGLYPSLHGLASGRDYAYRVYSGELQKIVEVSQRVGAYERSSLFEGDAYRVETAMEGFQVVTWTSAQARPMLEIGMNGVLISGLEDERRAKRYLATASLNKAEAMIEFALVRTTTPISDPRQSARMRVALSGSPRPVPSDDVQRCARQAEESICEISPRSSARAFDGADPRYLAATFPVPSRNPAIVATARTIAGGAADARAQVQALLAWLQENVKKSPVDVFTAMDVLQKREANARAMPICTPRSRARWAFRRAW